MSGLSGKALHGNERTSPNTPKMNRAYGRPVVLCYGSRWCCLWSWYVVAHIPHCATHAVCAIAQDGAVDMLVSVGSRSKPSHCTSSRQYQHSTSQCAVWLSISFIHLVNKRVCHRGPKWKLCAGYRAPSQVSPTCRQLYICLLDVPVSVHLVLFIVKCGVHAPCKYSTFRHILTP